MENAVKALLFVTLFVNPGWSFFLYVKLPALFNKTCFNTQGMKEFTNSGEINDNTPELYLRSNGMLRTSNGNSQCRPLVR